MEKMKPDIPVVKIDNEESLAEVIESLTSSVDDKLNKLFVDPSNSYGACIHKVSQKLRKANEASFTPRLVSVGPFHHEVGQLKGMEAYKLRFLHNFLSRFGIGLDTVVQFAAREESFVRGCYEGTIHLSAKQLSEIILVDGIFIVELFLESHFFQLRDRNEMIFENHMMYNDLLHDMLLLENQLPIRIMKGLLSYVDFSFLNQGIKLTIYDLAHKFFRDVGNTEKLPITVRCYSARHFVEFLLFLHAPTKGGEKPKSSPRKFEYTRSATELQEAGVKFYSGNGSCLFEVEFDRGVLTIPSLIVNNSTETFFRNLIAFEQCGYLGQYARDITSYVVLMDSLINTRHDVDLLVDHKIITNELGESEIVTELFNNLYKEVVTEGNVLYFADLCEKLNDYSRNSYHKLKAGWFRSRVQLKKTYFSNPWTATSLVAAFVLLVLTIIQTGCSILQVKQGASDKK